MANVDLNKFNITPHPTFQFATQDVYDQCHKAYHAGLAALTAKPAADENKTLDAKIKATRTEWRNTVDLSADDHEAFDTLKSMTEQSVFSEDGNVARLEALYGLLSEWTGKVKAQLDYEVSKVVNPNSITRGPNVTKEELKSLREFAINAVVLTNTAMSTVMPDLDTITTKSWEDLPKGRSASPKVTDGGKYIGSQYSFRVNDAPDDMLLTPAQLVEFLSTESDERWTMLKLQDHVSDNDGTWGREFSMEIAGNKVEALFVR